MFKKSFLIAAGFAIFFSTSQVMAFNAIGSDVCTGKAANSATCLDSQSKADPIAGDKGIIKTAANLIAIIGGIAATLLLVAGGIAIVTSGGDSNKVAKGRSMIIGAAIGLVIMLLSWVITTFVVSRFVS